MTADLQFWNWFTNHEPELFSFDPADKNRRELLFDAVLGELQKVHPDLCFEFGPPDAKRIFVISAGGLKAAFPAVVSLARTAPRLERWEIIPFRPRREAHTIEIQGKRVEPRDVSFTLLDNGKNAGIDLFIPGYREHDMALKQIGYLFLDEALGEFDVEMRLGLIRMKDSNSKVTAPRYPIENLPGQFDALVARLEGRPERVS